MPIYEVERKEIHISVIQVEADNPEHAKILVGEDDGDEVGFEYHSTMSPDQWIVRHNGELVSD